MYPNRNYNTNTCPGTTVYVGEGKFEIAMRKFKNKIRESGLLLELRDRESYKKPTTRRKEALAAAKSRDKKRLAANSMPKKLY